MTGVIIIYSDGNGGGEGDPLLPRPHNSNSHLSSMSKRLAESSTVAAKEDTEKKQRPPVYAPKFFHSHVIERAEVYIGDRYKANDNKTRFIPPAVIGTNNIEFKRCKDHWGPDLLVLVYPAFRSSPNHRFTLYVHRKTVEASEFRVVYPRGEEEIEMTAREIGDALIVSGPALCLCIQGKRLTNPQLEAIAKERELMAKVLLIRKEYEETVLPHLPVSIQFTGAMVLGSLLPSVTVELRKGQLEDAEKQLV